jgi:NAD(P)-dependent dehydrogenase (short-subunit alcohol dehydrogenase family)
VTCDVADERQVVAAAAAARGAFGGLDILVNSAAIFNRKGVIEMPLDEWQRQLEIILTGTFLFTKHVAKLMIEQGRRGTIINIISAAGNQGEPNNIAYCTAKSGLLNFTRSAAMELIPHGHSRKQFNAYCD